MIRAAALEALSRLPEDPDGRVLAALLDGLSSRDARCVESATFGLARTAPSTGVLTALWALAVHAEQGGVLLQREAVPPQVRGLAVQGLVAQAARSRDVELRRRVLQLLKRELDTAEASSPQIASAAITGIGLLCSEQVVLASQGAEWLLASRARETRASVRPHLLLALGRLGKVLADDELRRECSTVLLVEAGSGAVSAQRAAVLALGRMSRTDDALAPASRAVLLHLAHASPDAVARNFAVLSLADLVIEDPSAERTAGFPIVRSLLDGMRHGHGEERSWHSLALGKLAHHSALGGSGMHPFVQGELLEAFQRTRSPEPAAACALALGLARHGGASEQIRLRMESTASSALLRAGTPAIGLLGDRSQIPYLRALMADSTHDAETMRAAAIGLTMLGDFEVVPQLLRTLQACEGSASLERSLRASELLGELGDRRTVEPLIELLAASGMQPVVRVAVIRALGKICSGSQPAWDPPRLDGAAFLPFTKPWLGDDQDVGKHVAP